MLWLALFEGKKSFWEGMESVVNSLVEPWILFGDLNEVVTESEKWGGRSIWNRQLFLKKFIQQVGGIDLGYSGSNFT